MRCKTAITVASGALLLLALPWVITCSWPGSFSPRATLTLLGYERTNRTSYTEFMPGEAGDDAGAPSLRFGTSPPNPGAHVQTNAEVLLARVRLENSGTQPIAFQSWGGEVPDYGCRVQREGRWYDRSGYYFTGGPGMLDVGSAVEFRVWLPPDVTAWQFRLVCHSVGPRLRTALRWHDRGWRGWLPAAALSVLPPGSQVYADLQSDEFAVSRGGTSVQVSDLHRRQGQVQAD